MDAEAEAGPSGTSPAPAPPPSSSDAAWTKTRSGKRILELQDVEESIAQLLHFAGCTLASIHPDPLSSFTSKTVDFSDDPSDDDDGDSPPPPAPAPPADKETEFANYAEAYYTTLNDIQLSLRTSIRHLRLSRASPAPLIDPHFGSLSNPGGGGVGVGGVALGKNVGIGVRAVHMGDPRHRFGNVCSPHQPRRGLASLHRPTSRHGFIPHLHLGSNQTQCRGWFDVKVFVAPQAMNFIPIMVSLIMSPVWSLIGAERDVIARTHAQMATDQEKLEDPNVPEHEKRELRGKDLTDYLREIQKEKTSAALSTKAASYGTWGRWIIVIWFIHLIVWGFGTWYFIYADNYPFWQANCEDFIAQETAGTLTPLIATLILGVMACLLFILMLFVFWTGRGGVDLLFGRRKEGKDYGPSNYRSDFPLILRTKRQTIYHWVVSWAVFFVWFGINTYVYFYALDKFLLVGTDPWTYGQIEQVAFALPSFRAFILAIRSRTNANAKLAEENHAAYNARRVAAGKNEVAYDPHKARTARHQVRDNTKKAAAIAQHKKDLQAARDHDAKWNHALPLGRVTMLPGHAKHKVLRAVRPAYYRLPEQGGTLLELQKPAVEPRWQGSSLLAPTEDGSEDGSPSRRRRSPGANSGHSHQQ